ncbi:tRNA pseudouridine(55) synthase TruB [Longimicrobium sp.]|uniref:tRNA pseudouridine(55) synthase TruB n=1 Tax=Longimicrobium sp. TaxID=2029185 RepID=UPI002E35C331|nr:tRNA pseudouridine(55) synthase TruB [Longimicrobium sp.]HEX6042696.1 tRNA pseudouridine(55) synthase TruB [Longimicrobium sp.]
MTDAASAPGGILPVDKPVGPTSHDAVAAVRRGLRTRAVGHTGTLDPFASGLLLVCVGPATRLAEYFAPLPKTYVGTMRLGESTNTDDHTGEVIASSDGWRSLSADAIGAALAEQVGEIQQVPPAYSAKKVDGQRMYDVARRGGEVDLPPVPVTIYAIRVLSIDLPDVVFEVECGNGTYIRAIARDVGAMLGVGGHLRELRRTRIGPHDVDRAVPMDRLAEAERVAEAMIAPADALAHLPRVVADARGEVDIRHGRALPAPQELHVTGPVAIVSGGGDLLAVGESADGMVRPRKVFAGAA